MKRDKVTKTAKGARAPQRAARSTAKTKTKTKPTAAASAGHDARRRSGGLVDAPGKTHRRPLPSDPDATLAASQSAKMRTALPMEKTNRRRGRG